MAFLAAKGGNLRFGQVGRLFNGLGGARIQHHAFLRRGQHPAADQAVGSHTDRGTEQKGFPAAAQMIGNIAAGQAEGCPLQANPCLCPAQRKPSVKPARFGGGQHLRSAAVQCLQQLRGQFAAVHTQVAQDFPAIQCGKAGALHHASHAFFAATMLSMLRLMRVATSTLFMV